MTTRPPSSSRKTPPRPRGSRTLCVAFLLELTGAREIVLVKIGTDFNAADLFTKVLAVEKFDTFTAYVLGER